ncbi:FG-GAP-like repeat-containing protein, partial [Streptosporangium sp. NPDC004379]|uniref:FG-GAP-like repeat-containing protein n=1 Tax=Streptosporangium sp. NPDC004379 TaxID=3366189 RepID=UPI003691BAFE
DGTMTIWRWNSNGTSFTHGTDYESGPWTMNQAGNRVASGDVDGDGHDDIVTAYQNPDNTFSYHVWKNGTAYAGKWYTSGNYSLDPVADRLILGSW